MTDGLPVNHRESVRVTAGATAESFAAWLKTVPDAARISVNHTPNDRGLLVEYTISASWTDSVGAKEI